MSTPSEKSSHTTDSEHLPPIIPPPAKTFRHHVANNSVHGFQLTEQKSSPPSERKSLTKTMSTETTIKKLVTGGPVHTNGTSQSSRTASSESNRKARKLWWSPKRHQIEIRSDTNGKYKSIPSRIGSLANIDHRPGGGQIAIRDDRVQWQVTSKIGSLVNANWSPPPPRVTVRKEKIKWDAQSKVGSLININHRPTGGNIAIRDDKVDFSYVTPRIDCGFIE